MIKIMRGIVILAGILLIFLLITACSTDGIFAKRTKADQVSGDYGKASEKEEYTYNDIEDNDDRNGTAKSGKTDSANFYSRNDKDYAKDDDQSEDDSYYEKGNASWYGREFDGRKTASGEKYNMNKLTAAHKKLPFGTKILVKNLENDKTVSVTINDRGPYEAGRILDLSYAAAKKIGIVSSGEAKVGIKVIGKGEAEDRYNTKESADKVQAVAGKNEEQIDPGDNEEDESYDKSGFSVQAGAFYSRKNAEKFQKRLGKLVENPIVIVNDNDMYKIRIDKFASKKDALVVKKLLKKEEISSYVIENK